MSLLETIVEKENLFIKKVKTLDDHAIRLFVYGGGTGRRNVRWLLDRENISIAGYLVNKEYVQGDGGLEAIEDKLEELRRDDKSIDLLIAVWHYDKSLLSKYPDVIDDLLVFDCWVAQSAYLNGKNLISYQYMTEHIDLFEKIYNILEDNLSRQTMSRYINQKISMQYGYLSPVKRDHQYFDDGLIQLGEHEVLIDCGAFDGDTAMAFVSFLKRHKIDTYDEIISFEPDMANYIKLKNRNIARHRIINKGVGCKKEVLKFIADGTNGNINDMGSEEIEIDTIDNIMDGDRVSFIKMDIEGAEKDALLGAAKTIKKWRPKLAICAYHKAEDLYSIANTILNIMPDYKLYLRAYSEEAVEIVLYALPI